MTPSWAGRRNINNSEGAQTLGLGQMNNGNGRCPEAIINQPGMEVLAGPLGTGRRIEVFIWELAVSLCS